MFVSRQIENFMILAAVVDDMASAVKTSTCIANLAPWSRKKHFVDRESNERKATSLSTRNSLIGGDEELPTESCRRIDLIAL